jgi:anti-anti-sigma factor
MSTHFAITERSEGEVDICEVSGELTVHSGRELRSALTRLRDANRPLRLDLTQVTFLDSSGLGSILIVLEPADRRTEVEVRLPAHSQPSSIVRLTGVDKLLIRAGVTVIETPAS